MNEQFKKSAFTHVIAVALFLIVSLMYSLPALQGKELSVHDTVSWMAMSHEAREWYKTTGENPLWTNSMFGGMPTYSTATHGTNYVFDLQQTISDILPKPSFFFLFAMLCFYILMISWGVNKWAAMIGAIAYAFASYNLQIIVVGHNTKMYSMAYMPLVLAGMHWIYNQKYVVGASATLLGLALLVSNSMYQIDYYLAIIMFGFAIAYFVKAIQEKKVTQFFIGSAIMIVIAVLSILPSLNIFLVNKEYATQTMRGGQSELTIGKKEVKKHGGLDKDYAFMWSQSVGEVFTIFVPNLYGGGSTVDVGTGSKVYETMSQLAGEANAENYSKHAPMYWGAQPFLSGPNYYGAIIMLLFVLGLFVIKNNFKWVIAGIALLGIMMSLGKHFSTFNYFIFDHLPFYNNFRTPSMSMAIPGLMFCMLAIWALNEFISDKLDMKQALDSIKKSVIITGGLCLLLGVGGRMFLSFKSENDDSLKAQISQMFGKNDQAANQLYSAILEDRPNIAMKDGLRSFAFILLAGALLWLFASKKIKLPMALGGIGLLVAVDLLSIGTRYLNDESYMEKEEFEAQFNPRPVDRQIKQDPDPYYRVFDLSVSTYQDAMGAVHHKMIGGYHPAKLESYQDLIDNYMMPGGRGKLNAQVLNMLNTKYIIFNGQNNQPSYQPNPYACGNAWFINSVKLVDNADQEMLGMNAEALGDTAKVANAFQPKEFALVQKKHWKGSSPTFEKDSSSKIQLAKYGLNDLSYTSSNSKDGFGVFSEIYYPLGWNAYIDGKETDIIKTDYLLRGILIPAGNHKIEFKFRPQTYLKWSPLSTAASAIILLIVAAGIGLGLMKDFKKKEA